MTTKNSCRNLGCMHFSPHKSGWAIALLMIVAFIAAADQVLEFAAADKPATLGAGGELTFTYEGDLVSNLTAHPAGTVIVLQ